MLLGLIQDNSNWNTNNGNDETIFDYNKLSVLLEARIKSLSNMNIISNYNIEIVIQKSPSLHNFDDNLIVLASNETSLSTMDVLNYNTNNCLYTYNFSLDKHYTPLVRFIRLDENLVQAEAEFKYSECLASFFIHNDGCLSIKTDHLLNNNKCTKSNRNLLNSTDIMILKAGAYNVRFKLCYYDKNKVSCSSFYNQTIQIEKNLYNSSILTTRLLKNEYRLYDQLNSTKLKVFKLLQNSNQSIILLVLLVAVLVLALMAILTAIYFFFRTRSKRDVKNNLSCEKVFVLPPSSCETSSDSGMASQMHSSSNTPETSSNVTTSSSKLSKTDDEVHIIEY